MITPYKNEKLLFAIACALSGLFWLALLLLWILAYRLLQFIGIPSAPLLMGASGFLLVFPLTAFISYLFIRSAFISNLKGTAVLITAEQYPDLYGRLLDCCRHTGVDKAPDAYLLRGDYFNALATSFLGRNFIVLHTSVLDALEERPGAVNFYIGHELAHIRRKYVLWSGFSGPASMVPLLGSALLRAKEYTCDRYGAACCESDDDVCAALATIATGDTRWQSINVDAYLGQIAATQGFWMSFNELLNGHPWLTKRMAAALAYRRGEEFAAPPRHPLAKLCAAIIPRVGDGARGLAVAIVGIAILVSQGGTISQTYEAYTAFQEVFDGSFTFDEESAESFTFDEPPGETRDPGIMSNQAIGQAPDLGSTVAEGVSKARIVANALGQAYLQNNVWPSSVSILQLFSPDALTNEAGQYVISLSANVVDLNLSPLFGGAGSIKLIPTAGPGRVRWTCRSQDIDAQYVPSGCK